VNFSTAINENNKTIILNKVHSEVADFTPGAAICHTGRNLHTFHSPPSALLCEKHDVIHRNEST